MDTIHHGHLSEYVAISTDKGKAIFSISCLGHVGIHGYTSGVAADLIIINNNHVGNTH